MIKVQSLALPLKFCLILGNLTFQDSAASQHCNQISKHEVRDIVQETGIKTITMEKKCKEAKWLSGEVLQIAVKRREAKSKGEKKNISI